MDLRCGIRVARFPGEQCGIMRLSFRSHHIGPADVEEIAEVTRIGDNKPH
jgi:hypothetical protein